MRDLTANHSLDRTPLFTMMDQYQRMGLGKNKLFPLRYQTITKPEV